jgi:predicted aconitase
LKNADYRVFLFCFSKFQMWKHLKQKTARYAGEIKSINTAPLLTDQKSYAILKEHHVYIIHINHDVYILQCQLYKGVDDVNLNDTQQAMLDGKYGRSCKKAMEVLVQMGEASGAETMISVSFVHLMAPDIMFYPYGRQGRWAHDMTDALLEDVTSFRVPTTIDPQFCNLAVAETLQFPKEIINEIAEIQGNAMKRYEKLGVTPNYSALAFYVRPGKFGEHASVADSTPILWYNTVYGTRCERDDGVKALSAAITGYVPLSGVHISGNRYAEVVIKVGDDLDPGTFEDSDWDIFALAASQMCKEKRPVFVGIPKDIGLTELKHLIAVMAVKAGLSILHIVGVTPEAATLEDALQGRDPETVFVLGKKEFEAARAIADTTDKQEIDFVLLGCPHLTMKEIKTVADVLRGKKLHQGVNLVAVTTKDQFEQAKDMGYVDDITQSGAKITWQMCIAFAGTQVKGAIATNSAKAGFFFAGFGAEGIRTVRLGNTRACALAALTGKLEV